MDTLSGGENSELLFSEAQHSDESLENAFLMLKKVISIEWKMVDGSFILKTKFCFGFASDIRSIKQLVVTKKFRREVLMTVHDYILAGRLSRARTPVRIQSKFFRPGIVSNVLNYVRFLKLCYKMLGKGSVLPSPL